jgi:hypothetical protein
MDGSTITSRGIQWAMMAMRIYWSTMGIYGLVMEII